MEGLSWQNRLPMTLVSPYEWHYNDGSDTGPSPLAGPIGE